MTLAEALKRDNNNADLLRLIAAFAVIWGHAYSFVLGPQIPEPVGRLLVFDYAGSLAVIFFFFLSGILVTNSWLSNSSPIRFVLARALRIFPALILSAVFCVFILAPLLVQIPVEDYFSHTKALSKVLLHPHKDYALPGLFENTPFPSANGSIWTIRYEIVMYGLLLGAGLCGVFRHKAFASALLGAIVLIFMIDPERIEVLGLSNMNMGGRFPAFFAAGALFALYKHQIRITAKLVGGLILLAWLCRHGSIFQFTFYPAFLMTLLWLMTTKAVKAIRLPGDFSYGVYVFGWPIQKAMVQLFPAAGVHVNQALSMAAALGLAIVSWYVLEKPCIGLARNLASRFEARPPVADDILTVVKPVSSAQAA